MRDLLLVAFLGIMFLLAFRRPFYFTLVYAYIDIVAPQRLSYHLINSIPISMIAFMLMAISFYLDERKIDTRITVRQILILILLAYCGYMTTQAVEPLAAADKWSWVWKSLVFAFFLPLVLHKKLRLEAIILTYVLSASALIVTGGLKTVLSGGGGGYGALVILIDDNSGLYESSIISLVSIAVIPLILWLANYGTIFKPDWRVKIYAACLILACLLIPVGTQARTGLICIAVLGVLLLRFSKRRFLYMGIAVTLGIIALPFLPQSFLDRMGTMQNVQADESASTRLAVWKWTYEFALEHPMGGGFDSYRINKVSYDLRNADGSIATEGDAQVFDAGRAFHSSYFEMLGEHGFFGLFSWLFLYVGTIFRLEYLQRLYKARQRKSEQWVAPLTIALQNFLIIYMVGSLFVGVAFQPFPFGILAIAIAFDTYLARRRREAMFTPISSNIRRPALNM